MKPIQTTHTTADGYSLFVQSWLPAEEAQVVVCLVHGLGEHSGRYQHVAEFLNNHCAAMLAFDLRGHGRSSGKRGHVDAFESFMEDIHWLISEAQIEFPDLPCFIYGHSLGGLLTLNYVLRRSPNLRGVIVTSPGLRTALEEQNAKLWLARMGERLLPEFSLPTGLDPALLSHDQQVIENYLNDPLVHDRASFRMACATLDAIPYAYAEAHNFHLPLLLMHGGKDGIAFPRGSEEFAAAVLSGPEANKDCTLKIWENLYHETHNEPQKDEVLAYLWDWIQDRL
ncbi:MAG TPA: lysophospholipase [Anaerolineales bacterium]|nr:lysophospholipase [Anaerolineales bacterium]